MYVLLVSTKLYTAFEENNKLQRAAESNPNHYGLAIVALSKKLQSYLSAGSF